MSKTGKSFLLLAAIVLLDAAVYCAFVRPVILQWGASAREAGAHLAGDELAPFASSTRAITINAPRRAVWQWLVQLGADRGGFYSYTVLENLLGYETGNVIHLVPRFQGMRVGRIVPSTPGPHPGSPDERWSWQVVRVDPGKSFVLRGWGAFVLQDAGPGKTRLIVRTHGWDTPTLASEIKYFFMMPLHYIMERRMLMGIKARAEAGPGVRLSPVPDYLWLGGVLFAAMGIIALIFMTRGPLQAIAPIIHSILWLWTCLAADPSPVYALTLLAVVLATILWLAIRNSGRGKLLITGTSLS